MDIMRLVVPLLHSTGNFQWDEQYPNSDVFERDAELGQLWVAELEGQIVGMAAFTTVQEPEYSQAGWDITEAAMVVHRLAVHPAARGKGIAEALMRQAEKVALEQRIAIMRVDTNTQNDAAQRLFPKLGYTYAGEIGLSFRPGLRFHCFEKRLP